MNKIDGGNIYICCLFKSQHNNRLTSVRVIGLPHQRFTIISLRIFTTIIFSRLWLFSRITTLVTYQIDLARFSSPSQLLINRWIDTFISWEAFFPLDLLAFPLSPWSNAVLNFLFYWLFCLICPWLIGISQPPLNLLSFSLSINANPSDALTIIEQSIMPPEFLKYWNLLCVLPSSTLSLLKTYFLLHIMHSRGSGLTYPANLIFQQYFSAQNWWFFTCRDLLRFFEDLSIYLI